MPNSTIPPVKALVSDAVQETQDVAQRVRARTETTRRRLSSLTPPPSDEDPSGTEAPTVRARIPPELAKPTIDAAKKPPRRG